MTYVDIVNNSLFYNSETDSKYTQEDLIKLQQICNWSYKKTYKEIIDKCVELDKLTIRDAKINKIIE